jgi:hypothetical protein
VLGAAEGPARFATLMARAAATFSSGCLDTGSHSLIVSSFAARRTVGAIR